MKFAAVIKLGGIMKTRKEGRSNKKGFRKLRNRSRKQSDEIYFDAMQDNRVEGNDLRPDAGRTLKNILVKTILIIL